MVFVVVDHVDVPSWWHAVSKERIGLVTGAEVFVAVSGVVLGLVHRHRSSTGTGRSGAAALLRRSGKLYVTSVVVILVVLALRLVPGLHEESLTTYTEPTGVVHDLYPGATDLRTFVQGVALLRYGPGQFNIMGLYVVLLACAPLAVWLLRSGRWWLLLAVSAAGYLAAQVGSGRLIPSQFENSFSLLAWQFLFFSGMTAGFLRESILQRLSHRVRVTLVASASALALGFAVFAWNSPWAAPPAFPRLSLVSPDGFGHLYAALFDRRSLGLGRLANLGAVLIATYGMLTWHWPVMYRAVGRFLVPLGQATLYIFVVHLAFVLLLANVEAIHTVALWVGTVAHMAVLLTLWMMVHSRFLFGIVPR